MVDHRVAEETVEGPQAEHVPRHAKTRLVGEDYDAEIPVKLEGDDCAKAESYTAVPDDVAVRCLLDHPAKCVEMQGEGLGKAFPLRERLQVTPDNFLCP